MAARKKEGRASSSEASVGASGSSSSLDVSALRDIIEILEASEVTQLTWTRGNEKLFIRRGPPPRAYAPAQAQALPAEVAPVVSARPQSHLAPSAPAAPAQASAAAAAKPADKPGNVVTSPFVGTFYRTPAPDQPSFVEVGTAVKKGQVLCIVEAMKLMNEIESEFAGKIAEILVENGRPVEFGQPLFRIEPS